MNKQIIILLITIFVLMTMFSSCGQEKSKTTPYDIKPVIEDTGATVNDIINPYTFKKDTDLTEKEIDMIWILQNKEFDYFIKSDWKLLYECNDDRLLNNGIPSQIYFYFNTGRYNMFSMTNGSEPDGPFKGEFKLENNRLTLPIDPKWGTDETIVMDIVDGNKLAYNADLSSPDTESEIVLFGPTSEPFDINGLVFEINIPETISMNQ